MEKIKEMGIDEQTLIFITSDNGGLNNYSVKGLRGKKSNLWEGGHRVPGIFRWPGKIKGGTTCDVPISGVDFLPTICKFTDSEIPKDRKIDGTSLAELLTGKTETLTRETPLYWFFYRLNPALAIREGKWSLIADTNDSERPKTHGLIEEDLPFIKNSKPTRFYLYNLETDLAQKTDVSQKYPEVMERLKAKAIKLHAEVVEEGPVWKIPAGRKSKARIWNSY